MGEAGLKGYKVLLVGMITILLLSFSLLVGCGQQDTSNENGNGKILVYTSLFPIYDFAKKIGGEYVTVKSIVPPGAEPHEFEPSVKEMAELSQAQIFVYNGAGYESWVKKATENLDAKKTKVVDASTGVKLLTEANGTHDPHVWLDPVLAKQQAENIEKALISVDPTHEQDYRKNFEKLATELDNLDRDYKNAMAKAQKKQFVTAHRAFAYLANRYGLEQIAVTGLSPSVEPGQKELQDLIVTLKKNGIHYVAFEELVASKVAKTVQQEAGAEAVTLSAVENVTKEELQAGKSYVDLMIGNLEVLKKVLEIK